MNLDEWTVKSKYDITPQERFADKVYQEPNSGCWLWTAGVNRDGYGNFGMAGKTLGAHRVSYEAEVGPIPDGLELDHLCKVRSCVNPAHLEPVTHTENIKRGESATHWRTKTHCPQGHEYTEENTGISVSPKGSCRYCRECKRVKIRQRRLAKKLIAA